MLRLTHRIIRHPRKVLAIWLIVVAAGTTLALQLDGALSGGGFTNPRAEALLTQKAVQQAFGDSPNQLVIVLDGKKVLTADGYNKTRELLEKAGADTVTTPQARSTFESADGRTAVITAGFSGDNAKVQNLVPALQSKLAASGLADDVYVTGQPALDFQLNSHSKADATRAELIVFPLLIVVLLLVFGSVVATLLPLLVAGSALSIASGIGFVATQLTAISNLYSNIVSMIGLAVAVDYSLFIIKRFREELERGQSPEDAVVTTMETAGKSVLYSGGAVVLGLAALFIPRVMAFDSIALGGIAVTLVAVAVTIFVLPAGLVLLGHRVNRLRIAMPRRPKGATPRETRIRRPALVGVAGIIVMLAAAAPIVGISLQSPVASAKVLPATDPARTGLEVIQQKIGQEGFFPVEVVLTFPKNTPAMAAVGEVRAAVRVLNDQAGVVSVAAVTEVGISGEQLNDSLASGPTPTQLSSLWNRESGKITTRLIVTTAQGPDSVQAHNLVRDIRRNLPTALNSGTAVGVTGATAQGLDFDNTVVDSLPLVAGVVLMLTFLMLAFAFRSAILSGLALLFNVLVVGASLGLLALVQNAVSGQPLSSVTPILLFAVMFGLSMDYMVIIISRMREAFYGGMQFDKAVLFGAKRTRGMINSAAIIMVTVFSSFMTGQISLVREIGIGLAIAVTLDAVVIRMIVMPSILRAIGPRAFVGRRSAAVVPPKQSFAPSQVSVDA